MHLDRYTHLLRSGQPMPVGEKIEGLWGRILRGNKPEDFLTLTNDPERFVVLLLDEVGLSALPGKSGFDQLIATGYTVQDIETEIVSHRNQFKLVIFPAFEEAVLATWGNILDMVCQEYPRVASLIQRHRVLLTQSPSRLSFSWFEDQRGYKWGDVCEVGKSDSRFMTQERLLQNEGSLVDVREFLYHSAHLRELFSGDGWLYDKDGNRRERELVVRNQFIKNLGDYRLIDLDVRIPSFVEKTS